MQVIIHGSSEPVTEEVEDLPEPGVRASGGVPLPALGTHGTEAAHSSGVTSSRQAHADMLAHSLAPGVRAHATHSPVTPVVIPPRVAESFPTNAALSPDTPMALDDSPAAGVQRPGVPGAPSVAGAGAGAGVSDAGASSGAEVGTDVSTVAPAPAGFALTFKVTGSGATKGAVTLTVTKQETVGSLRARLACELEVPDVQLLKGRRLLAAEVTVADAGLAGETVVHCVVKVCC